MLIRLYSYDDKSIQVEIPDNGGRMNNTGLEKFTIEDMKTLLSKLSPREVNFIECFLISSLSSCFNPFFPYDFDVEEFISQLTESLNND